MLSLHGTERMVERLRRVDLSGKAVDSSLTLPEKARKILPSQSNMECTGGGVQMAR